ncbi:MAG: AraC family transcriptional regulator ligand-binding domain-containing protein [Pseudomonas sp.]|uniref:AraC family transcriptional regulator ligand-binding domain-containing protein n=1 Tax=Pseudomonas sp. TaxID=306 RepID=UPI003BB80031
MPLYDPVIPARYAQPLIDFVKEQQPQQFDDLLQICGVRDHYASADGAVLTMAQYDILVNQVVQLSGRNDLGLEMGRRIGRHSHQSLSMALANCKTLDEVFRMAARFWRQVTTAFVVTYRRQQTCGEWIFRPSTAMSRATLHIMEELFAVSVHCDYTELVGAKKGIDIYLSMPKPAHHALYRKLTPSRFHFSASPLPEVRCVLPADLLDKPLRQNGDGLPIANLHALPGVSTSKKHYRDWLTLMLNEAEGIQPTRESLAELLNVSPRTFSRFLASEGCNFRVLANEIRHQRACNMLAYSTQLISQVAYRLGYAEPAAFTRAFHNMAGIGPQEYRQQCSDPAGRSNP